MKKLLALFVSLALVLGFAACTETGTETIAPESVEITFTQTTLAPGSYTLTAKVLPEKASQDVTFTLVGTVPGVTIEGSTLTVTANAEDKTAFKVKAAIKTDPTISDTIELTVDNPPSDGIEIATAEQLLAIGKNDDEALAANYYLSADIDLGGAEWTPIGTSDSDSGKGKGLSGTFNGNGYSIKNFKINGAWNSGFFGQIEATGKVIDLGLENGELTGNAWSGALVGTNHGLIENCFTDVTVTMSATPGGAFAGANVGENAIIRNSYAKGQVTSADVTCFSCSNDGGQIQNCYLLNTSGNKGIGAGTDIPEILKSNGWMTTAQNYKDAGWDEEVWSLVDGYFPMLKHEGFVAPDPISPAAELTITNESAFISYPEQTTLQITYSISNIEDSVTFALEEQVAGVSISDKGLVTLDDEVTDGTTFTVVVTSTKDETLSAKMTFTVNRANAEEVIEISSYEQLAQLADSSNPADMAKNYRLTNDIEIGNWFNTSIGSKSNTAFTGTFDGNGYTISEMKGGDAKANFGIFKEIGEGGVVKNLGIKIATNNMYVGAGSAGITAVNRGTIENICIEGTIQCTGQYAAGIAFENYGTIRNVVMLAKIIINDDTSQHATVGAIAYNVYEGSTIENCFVDKDTTGLTSVKGQADQTLDNASCFTTEEMKKVETFASKLPEEFWDFTENFYPALKNGQAA